MRLPILAATAALMVGPAAAQPEPAMPPRPMRDTPVAQPPLKVPPSTLGDCDAACERGDQPACEEAARIRAKLSGGALVPDSPSVSEGGGTLSKAVQ
jgi:hypothetical protein